MKVPTELIELCKKIVNLSPWNIRSIILSGSYAKKEFSILKGEELEIFSDYDLEVIVRLYNPFLIGRINKIITDFPMKVTVGIIPEFLLNRLKMIQIFEMKRSGILIFGDRDVLEKIPMETSSDIPIWEGIRYLLNANMELVESVNYSCFKGKISQSQFQNMVYSCAKAYLICCKALLVLIGEFRINLFESYELFANYFPTRFKGLRKKLPLLVEKIHFGLNFKLEPKLDKIPRSLEIWFETRDYLLTTLEYCLSKYLGRPNESLFSLLEHLLQMPPKILQNLAYLTNLIFSKKKFPPILMLFKIPILLAQISGIYLSKAIDEKMITNRAFLEKAIKNVNMVYPVNISDRIEIWDSVRNIILNIWKIAPDYVLNV